MDIIASHRLGLIEQFESESIALAGGPRDAVQRAVVYHHVSDMLCHAHGFALLAAEASLALDAAIERLERVAARWRWRIDRAGRAALVERTRAFGATLRAIDAQRCAGVLMAYRLVATPGLGSEAALRLDRALVASLQAVHVARGQASAAQRAALFDAHLAWADAQFDEAVERALDELDWPLRAAALRAVLGVFVISPARFARAERRGLMRIERRIRVSKQLTQSFAANPAQAFFKLQRRIIERRRGNDGDHLSPDEAVRLAA